MTFCLRALVCCCAALFVALHSPIALAAPVSPQVARADLARIAHIEVAAGLSDGQALHEWLTERTYEQVLTTPPPPGTTLVIQVTGQDYAFGLLVYAEQNGTPLAYTKRETSCDCTRTELVAIAMRSLADILADLARAPTSAPTVVPLPKPKPEPEHARPPVQPTHKQPLVIAGATALGVGLASVAAAGALIGVGVQKKSPAFDQGDGRERDFRPTGFACLAVGGIAIVTGVALVIAGVKKHKSAAKQAAFQPSWTGLSLSF